MKAVGVSLVTCILLVSGCQELNPHLDDGVHVTAQRPPSGDEGSPDGSSAESDSGGGGALDGGVTAASCDTTRARARAILQANCATCHQAPQNSTSIYGPGPFNFILDLAKLTTANDSLQTKYVVSGNASQSYLYLRVSTKTMPPPSSPPLAQADVDLLHEWITDCVSDDTTGWDSETDGGESASAQ